MIVKDLEIEYQTLSEQELVDVDGGWYGCSPCYSGCYPYYSYYDKFSFDFSFKFDKGSKKPKDSDTSVITETAQALAIPEFGDFGV